MNEYPHTLNKNLEESLKIDREIEKIMEFWRSFESKKFLNLKVKI